MTLTTREERMLQSIEAQLVAGDPAWAAQFTRRQGSRTRRLRRRWAVVLVLAALLACGVALGCAGLVLVASAALMWTAALSAVCRLGRRCRGRGGPAARGDLP